ncbi:MAG: peptidoglycan DD-metalloendopeptidase family protein [Gaiellaceae bacterium]
MQSHRTTARGVLLILALGLAAAASAAPAGKPPARIVFPVIGPAEYFAGDYGAPRPQGRHEGQDIMSVRRALAVAAEAGRVDFETGSGRAGCMLRLHGASGTDYSYIHLNNDLSSGNDNRGRCVAGVAFTKGLKSGQPVSAGEPVGYVGDSGDADGGQPHLHFEIHPGGGGATNPYSYLRRAQRLLFWAPRGSTFTLGLTGTVVKSDGVDLSVKVEVLNSFPNGVRGAKIGRTLRLDSSAAVVQSKHPSAKAFEAAVKGQRVTVFTAPAPVTLEAQLGKGLLADRIVVLGG